MVRCRFLLITGLVLLPGVALAKSQCEIPNKAQCGMILAQGSCNQAAYLNCGQTYGSCSQSCDIRGGASADQCKKSCGETQATCQRNAGC